MVLGAFEEIHQARTERLPGFFISEPPRRPSMTHSNWSRESRHARGYGTAWDKLRLLVLQRDHGLCQCDHCKGGEIRLTPATEVDHVISKAKARARGWTDEQIDDPSNLQSINEDCHKRKTEQEQGKVHRPKVRIGADGYPIVKQ